ncbi:hypothetical protein PV08_06521 [Exophiala spinifera]|uniref:Kinetochore protein fta4 n=1 Tax=Exophiala spinifera TaxID=91928 RepID=A0A0D1ZUP6_9EURO|nr:uncharacterized protein PV08_06521 [Exophiala spinifera]KIW16467.1 hypothetical protein PV08_06521 [Exophiala spinifera]
MNDESITSLKAAFLRSQVRHLSTPLAPSTDWREDLPEPEGGHLSDKVVQDVVTKVNEKIKQHNRMVFSQQSQRHVAEQIETLHWNIVNAELNEAELHTSVVRRDADLTTSSTIETLPEELDDALIHPERPPNADEAETYNSLRSDLLNHSRRRDALKQKLARYRALQKLMAPLDDPQTNIQPNLVTRDGELGTELDRTRVLLARVSGRVADVHNTTRQPTANGMKQSLSNEQKLAALLDPT